MVLNNAQQWIARKEQKISVNDNGFVIEATGGRGKKKAPDGSR